MSFVSRYVRCAGYEIHLTDWGTPGAPVANLNSENMAIVPTLCVYLKHYFAQQ